MLDKQQDILNEIFEVLSKDEILHKCVKRSSHKYVDEWLVEIEIEKEDIIGVVPITIILKFPLSFPHTLPKVYLSDEDYKNFKYSCHINNDKSICTYDLDNLLIDYTRPVDIVIEILSRTKEILNEALSGWSEEEYKREFLSYWLMHAVNDDSLYSMSLLEDVPDKFSKINVIYVHGTIFPYRCILYLTEEKILCFKQYLEKNNLEYSIIEALYIPNLLKSCKPPYISTLGELNKQLCNIGKKELDKYYTKYSSGIIISAVECEQKKVLIGFKLPTLKLKMKGFRKGKVLPSFAIESWDRHKVMRTLYVELYSSRNIEIRTAGMKQPKYNFLVAGLGSIGSNLVFFLNALNSPSFTLVDSDVLSADNIGRHLLGFADVHKLKVKAMREYLQKLRPEQNVKIEVAKLENTIERSEFSLNEFDCIFLTTGDVNVNSYIYRLMKEGKMKLPVFILHVEPYLFGGHLLYLDPNDDTDLEYVFKEEFYRYNVISDDAYKENKDLLISESASCHSYAPYSKPSIISFLSAIYNDIIHIITISDKKSHIIRWCGDLTIAEQLNINIKPNMQAMTKEVIL